MATVKDYSANKNISTGGAPEAAELNTFSNLKGLGGALAQTGAEAYLRQADYDAQMWATNQMSELRIAALSSADEAKQTQEPGAKDFAALQDITYTDLTKQYRSSAPNTRAQQMFDVASAKYKDDYFNLNMNYEFSERNSFNFKSQIESSKKESVALLQTPEAWQSIFEPRMWSIDNLNLPGSEKDKLKASIVSEYSETVVRALGNKDPKAALTMVDDGTLSKTFPGWSLSGPKLDNLRWHLMQRVKANETEARIQLLSDVNDSLADYESGVISDPVPVGRNIAEIRAILTPAQFAKWQRSVETATSVRAASKDIQFGPNGTAATLLQGNKQFITAYEPYRQTVETVASKYSLDQNILAAQIWKESKFNKDAKGPVLKDGTHAEGISQFIPKTAARFNLNVRDPHASIESQGKYMRTLLDQFGGDYSKALAAYNWGEGNVSKAINKYGSDWIGHAPSETQDYVAKILGGVGSGVAGKKARERITIMGASEEQLRNKDPAFAADRNLAAVDQNYSGVSLQERLSRRQSIQMNDFKLPSHKVQLLTQSEAEGFAATISSSTDVEGAQQTMKAIKDSIVGKDANDSKSLKLWNTALAQIIDKGKLDKGYMFMNYTSGRMYGNTVAQALRLKSDAAATEGLSPQSVKDAKDALYGHQGYQDFLNVLAITGGPGGGEYSATFAKLMEKTVFLAMRDRRNSPSTVVNAVFDDLVGSQQTIHGTYFVPSKDPYTGQRYDGQAIANTLDKIGDNWIDSRGGKFEPRVHSNNKYLSSEYLERSIKNADNLVWITNEDSSGVYRAIQANGAPGLYIPIYNKRGGRYEIRFSDVYSAYNSFYGVSTSNKSSGDWFTDLRRSVTGE